MKRRMNRNTVSTRAGNGNQDYQDEELDGNQLVAAVAAHGVTPPVVRSLLPPLLQSSFVSDIQRHLSDTGSFHDVCFVVEEERIPAHRSHLSAIYYS